VKENADTITMANAGIGAASHLCGMLFMQAVERPDVTVPYKGTGPAMTDLLGGQVDIMCDQTTNTTEQIKGGTIKAYAVTTRPARLDIFPDLPTAAKPGLPGMEVSVWHGIYTPEGHAADVTSGCRPRCSRRWPTRTSRASPNWAPRRRPPPMPRRPR
jgi:tripartite-type tricarboxylate transporter receptor subunit TctC